MSHSRTNPITIAIAVLALAGALIAVFGSMLIKPDTKVDQTLNVATQTSSPFISGSDYATRTAANFLLEDGRTTSFPVDPNSQTATKLPYYQLPDGQFSLSKFHAETNNGDETTLGIIVMGLFLAAAALWAATSRRSEFQMV